MQTSADAIYGARHVGLKAGLKVETPAVTVNRLCGSGIEAMSQAAQRLLLGEATMVLAGGMENMTQAPFVIRGARNGLKLGGGALEDSLFVGLTDQLLRIADGDDGGKIGGAAGDYAAKMRTRMRCAASRRRMRRTRRAGFRKSWCRWK